MSETILEDVEILKYLEKNSESAKYVEKNLEKLSNKYENKLIAVNDKKIIADSDNPKNLIEEIESKGYDSRWIYITSFPPKEVAIIYNSG